MSRLTLRFWNGASFSNPASGKSYGRTFTPFACIIAIFVCALSSQHRSADFISIIISSRLCHYGSNMRVQFFAMKHQDGAAIVNIPNSEWNCLVVTSYLLMPKSFIWHAKHSKNCRLLRTAWNWDISELRAVLSIGCNLMITRLVYY